MSKQQETNQGKGQIGELLRTVREMRKQGRGGEIPKADVEAVGELLDTVKKAIKERTNQLDDR